jgi:hypothetical protein
MITAGDLDHASSVRQNNLRLLPSSQLPSSGAVHRLKSRTAEAASRPVTNRAASSLKYQSYRSAQGVFRKERDPSSRVTQRSIST